MAPYMRNCCCLRSVVTIIRNLVNLKLKVSSARVIRIKMGLTAAALYSIWPEKMSRVELSYMEPAFRGSLDVRGRISPGVLAFYGTLFAVSKPVRDLLIDVVKFALRYRKAQKAKKEAEAKEADKKQAADKNNKAKESDTKDKAAA